MMTNDSWRCSSGSQQGWSEASFDDSSWPIAVRHGINSYDDIESFPWSLIDNITVGAWWIWTKDNRNNDSTIYCRLQLRNDSMEECIVGRSMIVLNICMFFGSDIDTMIVMFLCFRKKSHDFENDA